MYRVFIVDDEPFIIEGLYDIIDWAGLGLEIVGHAENGRKALEAMKQTLVDILITDISMPVMDGLELIHLVREFHEELKVIVLSGFNEFSYLKEGMRLGIENYLLKPINVEELRSTLINVVDKLDSFKEGQMIAEFNTQILKDNTLHRWLTHQIGESEFVERADLLHIEFNHPYMAAAVLRLEKDHAEVFELIGKQLKNNRSLTLFRDIDGDLIVLAVMDDVSKGREVFLQVMKDIQEKLVNYRPLRISIGSVECLPDQAAASYRNAKKTQDYFWIYPELELMDYGELPIRQELDQVDFTLDWAVYVKTLISKDKDSLHQQIKSDFSRIQTLSGVMPHDIQNVALEMIVRFKVELKAIRHTDDDPELFYEAFQRVRAAETIDELSETIQDVADMTVDFLISDVKSPVVQQVLNRIDKAYAEELSLKMLGIQYNIHPVYLGQLFHKETGQTFTEFINKYRIDKAKELLTTTNLKVHEIARNVGYWETGYFYKQFKKYVGISPTDYKGLL
ncbi:DNA-binding response regulator [Paenibacillus baekrokdamisoli]|uniref:DNA-binding response regulator n=1 Tax=Paenibacillus baekrokdamisoli TaxID=1712516 RepID=A0A3G9ISV4_9BACL|nr:response regulator transcription factor [Paenibacillus baekrokdamisoli]BBH21950.1 DNA-binding response regulator [Paenibacillus baekrokdamisoli]